MDANPIQQTNLLQVVELTARALHSLGHEGRFYPAQWVALRYFATANPDHRTAMDLARFQGLAFGAVSRTVRTLIDKGVLRKAGSLGKGRSTRIELTRKGRARLARDPHKIVEAAVADLSAEEQDALGGALKHMLGVIHARKADT